MINGTADAWDGQPTAMGPETDTDAVAAPNATPDTLTARALRTMVAEKKVNALQAELALLREKLAHRETHIQSLTISLDLRMVENVQLLGVITEQSAAFNEVQAQLDETRQALSVVETERDEAVGSRDTEIRSFKSELDAMSLRAVTAERQVDNTWQSLVKCRTQNSDAERAISKAEGVARDHEQQIKQLTERETDLLTQVQIRGTALANAEERITVLSTLLYQLEAKLRPLAHHSVIASAKPAAEPPVRRAPEIVVGQRAPGNTVLQRELNKDAWLLTRRENSRSADIGTPTDQARPARLPPHRSASRISVEA